MPARPVHEVALQSKAVRQVTQESPVPDGFRSAHRRQKATEIPTRHRASPRRFDVERARPVVGAERRSSHRRGRDLMACR